MVTISAIVLKLTEDMRYVDHKNQRVYAINREGVFNK